MVEAASMDTPPPKKTMTRKRKKKTKSPVEEKIMKLDTNSEPVVVVTTKQNAAVQKTECPQVMFEGLSMEEIVERYPVLKNEELVQRFLNVSITNNQKGRIRQILRDNLKGTSDFVLPDVIHDRIQSVLKSSADLTDTDLRKIRILYNMLKTAVKAERMMLDKKLTEKKVVEKKTTKKEKEEIVKVNVTAEVLAEKKEQLVKKVKGKKRYVVFIGNLPLDINKEKIMKHFSEMNENIVDIRIPKAKEDKKSAIAYVELKNEPSYELALSKHHSMLDNRRINVLYSTQKNSKISKAEAKSKSAKLVALQKSGKLIGSTPHSKKRSHRRAILKRARAKEAQV